METSWQGRSTSPGHLHLRGSLAPQQGQAQRGQYQGRQGADPWGRQLHRFLTLEKEHSLAPKAHTSQLQGALSSWGSSSMAVGECEPRLWGC